MMRRAEDAWRVQWWKSEKGSWKIETKEQREPGQTIIAQKKSFGDAGSGSRRWAGSGAAVSAVGGPRDAAALEIQSDEVAVVRAFLAIDNLSADRDFVFQGSYLRTFTSLPLPAGHPPRTLS